MTRREPKRDKAERYVVLRGLIWVSRELSVAGICRGLVPQGNPKSLSPGVAITLVSFVEGWSSGSKRASHWLATIPRLKKHAACPSVSAPISTVGLQGEAWSSASRAVRRATNV